MDAPTTTPAQSRHNHPMYPDTWQPEPGTLYTIIQFQGTEDQVQCVVQQISHTTAVVLHIDASATMPPDAWERLPRGLLSASQQALVREDLRHTKREDIAVILHLSPQTITTYRTTIRRKFLTIPAEERPLWMQIWLRYFPGTRAGRTGVPRDAQPRAKRA
ncbi:MAG: hypothetical protein OHK0022_23510 [Roseiflexaceae bacterium]